MNCETWEIREREHTKKGGVKPNRSWEATKSVHEKLRQEPSLCDRRRKHGAAAVTLGVHLASQRIENRNGTSKIQKDGSVTALLRAIGGRLPLRFMFSTLQLCACVCECHHRCHQVSDYTKCNSDVSPRLAACAGLAFVFVLWMFRRRTGEVSWRVPTAWSSVGLRAANSVENCYGLRLKNQLGMEGFVETDAYTYDHVLKASVLWSCEDKYFTKFLRSSKRLVQVVCRSFLCVLIR